MVAEASVKFKMFAGACVKGHEDGEYGRGAYEEETNFS